MERIAQRLSLANRARLAPQLLAVWKRVVGGMACAGGSLVFAGSAA